jgi:hypothetical protein
MSVLTLIICQRLPYRLIRVRDPSWYDVESAIRALDGSKLTEVMLVTGEAVGMHIIGGLRGHYFCEVHSTSGVKRIMDESHPEDNTITVIEGEDPEFPESVTTGLDVTVQAALAYYETNECDPKLTWID